MLLFDLTPALIISFSVGSKFLFGSLMVRIGLSPAEYSDLSKDPAMGGTSVLLIFLRDMMLLSPINTSCLYEPSGLPGCDAGATTNLLKLETVPVTVLPANSL